MPSRVLDFFRSIIPRSETAPEPPPVEKNAPGAVAYFMDENERVVLYQKPWPYVGCPSDDRTNSTTWLIHGQSFGPSRRDTAGNWIFRRCAK